MNNKIRLPLTRGSSRRRHGRRTALAHLTWAALFLMLADMSMSLASGQGFGHIAALPGFLYGVLPLAAAVSVPFVQGGRGYRRRLLELAGITVVLMLALDVLAPPAFVTTGQRLLVDRGSFVTSPRISSLTSVSASHVLLEAMTDRPPELGERLPEYSADHPRLVMARALTKAGMAFLPILLVAIGAAISSWMLREVTVRARALQSAFVAVWVAAPAIFWATYFWSRQAQVSALVGDGTLPMILLPYLPLSVLAWTCWQSLAASDIAR